jgi:serine/threonine protein phosphatase 1
MRKFCVGDIHSSYKGLIQVFESSNFDFNNDKVIFSGDYLDGWSQSKETLDFILSIPNKECIMGNHDEWLLYYYKNLEHYANDKSDTDYSVWKAHGGGNTIKSLGDKGFIEQKYLNFYNSLKYYHEEDGNLFIHAGYSILEDDNGDISNLTKQHPYSLVWDREFINTVYLNRNNINFKLNSSWKEIFIGHTPTIKFDTEYKTPQNWLNVWNVDTGSAFTGRISMMDIETKEVFQSDDCMKLYPDEKGRNKYSYNQLNSF